MYSAAPGQSRIWVHLVALATVLTLGGCSSPSSPSSVEGPDEEFYECSISDRLVDSGTARGAIPALIDPPLVGPDSENATYLADTSRVIGVSGGEQPLAVPHNILWFHEIVNLNDWGGRPLAVTYCPLTGSSLAFDRSAADGAEFGVSGLLLDNNLVMFDRREEDSLWPQMKRKASCGSATGTALEMVPVVEMRWSHWKQVHPDTKVISSETGHGFLYAPRAYPYGDYEQKDNERLLVDGTSIDDRRPPKERVLGIPNTTGGLALPFGELDNGTPARTLEITVRNTEMVVFWRREAQGAMAFETSTPFSVEDGRIVDDETGSVWSIEGRAIEGPRKGDQIEPVESAHVAFWFAWAVFHPQTRIWESFS